MEDLYKTIADVFRTKVEDIRDDLGPGDIENWDSLGQMRLICALETRYRITFEIAEMFEIFTVGDIKKILARKGVK